jgi:hypothetical protein
MWAGKTTEGYDLLSGIKLLDLKSVSDSDHPERISLRVQAIIERQPRDEADENCAVMDVLIRAAKRGDQGASELLVFGTSAVVRWWTSLDAADFNQKPINGCVVYRRRDQPG